MADDSALRQTPVGSTRRYGSPEYPLTITVWSPLMVNLTRLPFSTGARVTPFTAGFIPVSVVRRLVDPPPLTECADAGEAPTISQQTSAPRTSNARDGPCHNRTSVVTFINAKPTVPLRRSGKGAGRERRGSGRDPWTARGTLGRW